MLHVKVLNVLKMALLQFPTCWWACPLIRGGSPASEHGTGRRCMRGSVVIETT